MAKDLLQVSVASLHITLPIVVTILIAAWLNNRYTASVDKRINDLRAEIVPMLREILSTLKDLHRRVTRLEERSSPIVRG